MSLRAKVLLLFVTLAVIPLVTMTVFDYLQSVGSLEGLIRSQNGGVAQVAAREVSQLYARRQEELDGILTGPEVRRLAARGEADSTAAATWRAEVQRVSGWIAGAQLIDGRGRVVASVGDVAGGEGAGCPGRQSRVVLSHTAEAAGGSGSNLTVRAAAEADSVFPAEALGSRVGPSGFTAVVNRRTGELVYRGRCDVPLPEAARVAAAVVGGDPAGTSAALGGRVVSFEPLSGSDWAVVASVTPPEFTAPFARARGIFVLLVLFVGAATSLAFAILLGRITRTLRDLSDAAGEVAAGNFTPALPPPGSDEVGRLSYSIGVMAGRVQRMLRQIESTRQLATMGEFATRVSHEIRNPLSSIRLNLQGMERDVRRGQADDTLREPLEVCLKEVNRLDEVVRGMLALAREEPMRRQRFSVHEVIGEAEGVLRRQLELENVRLALNLEAASDAVIGDEVQMRGVVMNLVLNAAQAMEGGGTVHVRTASDSVEGREVIRVHVRDEGPGVPDEVRDRIFRPFVSTKSGGTGLGLPIARRTAQQHGGTLYLEQGSALQTGAEFVLVLPLAAVVDAVRASDDGRARGATAGATSGS